MIIVTGANRGIGKSICERLIKSGKRVIGLVRTEDFDEFDFYKCDVSKYESVKSIAREIKKIGTPIEAFINSAGVASMNLAVTTDHKTVQNIIQTNLIGTINCCQLFSPILMRQKEGCFINFSTIAVPLSLKGESVYAASKAGVEVFSKSFAREIADFNIRVNCIAPGPIKTDLLKGITKEQIDKILSLQIIPKQFNKSDVCDLVELLIDKKSSSLSGQVLHIGGV